MHSPDLKALLTVNRADRWALAIPLVSPSFVVLAGPSRSGVMREYVWLECTSCGDRNYRTQKETRGAERLELKKYCKRERKHVPHKESRKK
jgi:large subunit ribosomal protein L33